MTTDWNLYREFYNANEAGEPDEVLQVLWDRFADTLEPVPPGWTIMDFFRDKTPNNVQAVKQTA